MAITFFTCWEDYRLKASWERSSISFTGDIECVSPPSSLGIKKETMVELSKDTRTEKSGGRGGLLLLLSFKQDKVESWFLWLPFLLNQVSL